MKQIFISTFLFSILLFSTSVAQIEFLDDFEEYTMEAGLVCQNPIDWSTWSDAPCSNEDPIVYFNWAYSGSKSVLIEHYNDLIKSFGNISSGKNFINFWVYIPVGKMGYFSLLSRFTPEPFEWAMECYFDIGGTGRIMGVQGEPIYFNHEEAEWFNVHIMVDLDIDEAQLWIDGVLIHIWQWTQNGLIADQLAVHNFYGVDAGYMMFIDFYYLFNNCLYCYTPDTPSNLTTQQVFGLKQKVKLTWQDNSWDEYAFNVLRKSGLPNNEDEYELIGTVFYNTTEFIDSNVVIDSTYSYGIVAYNMYGYSDTSNIASITLEPLPVELISFTYIINGSNVDLSWRTSTEINNFGFDIERKSEYWENIAFVNGNGTTTEPKNYSYSDKSVAPGKYQYRLRQIDYNGSYEYSDIVEVDLAQISYTLLQNYPNPFNPTTNIQFTVGRQQFTTLKVYDVLGKEAATLINEEKSAGEYEVEFNATGLPSGIYFYQLKAEGFIKTNKMVIVK